MINDVDESLRALLERDVVRGNEVELSFDAPNNDWASKRSAPALNLYLYDVREDVKLRHVGVVERRSDGRVADRTDPARSYTLSYLVTAWTNRPQDSHQLLSAALAALVRHDALPADVLQGSLADPPRRCRVTVAVPPPQDRSLSDIWSALGGELKPSLDLVVTAPLDTGRVLELGPPVERPPQLDLHGMGP